MEEHKKVMEKEEADGEEFCPQGFSDSSVFAGTTTCGLDLVLKHARAREEI